MFNNKHWKLSLGSERGTADITDVSQNDLRLDQILTPKTFIPIIIPLFLLVDLIKIILTYL